MVLGKPVVAHRAIYEWKRGPIPDGMKLDHLCRNPSCVNPDHLEIVTQCENVRRGNSTKISIEQAKTIKSYPKTTKATVIAREIGVNPSIVRDVRNGISWRDVS